MFYEMYPVWGGGDSLPGLCHRNNLISNNLYIPPVIWFYYTTNMNSKKAVHGDYAMPC